MESNTEKAKRLQKIFDNHFKSKGVGAAHTRVKIVKASVTTVELFQQNPVDGSNYVDCSSHPLFSNMTLGDLQQRFLADCYFLSAIGSLINCAKGRAYLPTICFYDPADLKKVIVCYQRYGTVTRIHCDLLIAEGTQNAFGPDGDLYVEILEKTYSLFRTSADLFSSLNYGFSGAVWSDLGCGPTGFIYTSTSNLLDTIRKNIADQVPMAFATPVNAGLGLVGNHEYVLTGINADNSISAANPWGGLAPDPGRVIQPNDFLNSANVIYVEYGSIPVVQAAIQDPKDILIESLKAQIAKAVAALQ